MIGKFVTFTVIILSHSLDITIFLYKFKACMGIVVTVNVMINYWKLKLLHVSYTCCTITSTGDKHYSVLLIRQIN